MKALQNLAFRPGLPARLVSVFILPVLFAGCLSEEERVLPGDVDKTPTVKSSTAAVGAITVADLLDEMHDLERLARLEKHPFRTVQYSSYDRRSRSPDGEAWFSNADGFGREPIPGFEAVLAEADGEGTGSYLLCDVTGPGVIVRGWSAAMGGVLRVYLDGAADPLYEGAAYDFLARRSTIFFKRAGFDPACGDGFVQQDADYFPVPFSRGLRITWEGNLKELHFYHLQVRLYEASCPVATFDLDRDVKENGERIERTVARLTSPCSPEEGAQTRIDASVAPGTVWTCSELPAGPGAVTSLVLRVRASDRERALRGTVLRLSFDGAQRAQVEAPVGDFFGAGPGVNPFSSLPMTVEPDGTMTCRFVMPFKAKAVLTLQNFSGGPVDVDGSITVSAWEWDSRSCYFRARWRADHDLDLNCPIDMPYVVIRGAGRFVGCALQIANPSPVPTPSGSWWGEGDEKIFVDDVSFPCAFGTGSEDYFNYSWSRPDLFDHPFCGQPLNSGPGNSGYVANYRWHVLDAIPFESLFAFYMELWHHHPFPGLSYARTAYVYTRPGAIDDHRRLLPGDLCVPPIAPMKPRPLGGASRSTFHPFDKMKLIVSGQCDMTSGGLAPSNARLVDWKAVKGCRMTAGILIPAAGTYVVNVVAAHRPDGGTARFLLDGIALQSKNLGGAETGERGSDRISMKSSCAHRRLSTAFEARELKPGEHEIVIDCLEDGSFGFDYLWIKRVDR